MCEGTGVDPRSCVRYEPGAAPVIEPPGVDLYRQGNYTFAVAILEGEPVFIGGVLYHKLTGISFDVTDDVTVDSAKHSWNKPKRTFVLAGRELPLPSKTVTQCNAYAGSAPYYFDDPADRYAFEDALNTIIHEAIENARLQNK